jgi:hypothetical protein
VGALVGASGDSAGRFDRPEMRQRRAPHGATMSKLFISHSSQDDAFVRELQQALGDLKQDVWIDSRELRGGDPLWAEIQKAIEVASTYAVVVSTDALQSKCVGKERATRSTCRDSAAKTSSPLSR